MHRACNSRHRRYISPHITATAHAANLTVYTEIGAIKPPFKPNATAPERFGNQANCFESRENFLNFCSKSGNRVNSFLPSLYLFLFSILSLGSPFWFSVFVPRFGSPPLFPVLVPRLGSLSTVPCLETLTLLQLPQPTVFLGRLRLLWQG